MRLRVLTADKRMPSEDASAGFGEGLRQEEEMRRRGSKTLNIRATGWRAQRNVVG